MWMNTCDLRSSFIYSTTLFSLADSRRYLRRIPQHVIQCVYFFVICKRSYRWRCYMKNQHVNDDTNIYLMYME